MKRFIKKWLRLSPVLILITLFLGISLGGCFNPDTVQFSVIVNPTTGFIPLNITATAIGAGDGGQYIFELYYIEDLAAGVDGRVLVESKTRDVDSYTFRDVRQLPAIVVCSWGNGVSGMTAESEIITEQEVKFVFHRLIPDGSSYSYFIDPVLRPYERYYFNANYVVGEIEQGIQATNSEWEIIDIKAYGEDYEYWGYDNDPVFSPPYDETEYHATPRLGGNETEVIENAFVIYPGYSKRYEQIVLHDKGVWKKQTTYIEYDKVKYKPAGESEFRYFYCVHNYEPDKQDGEWFGYHTPGEEGSEIYWEEIPEGTLTVSGARMVAPRPETGYAYEACTDLGSPNVPGCQYHAPQNYYIEVTVKSGNTIVTHKYTYRLNAMWR